MNGIELRSVHCDTTQEITDVCIHSDAVEPGALFVALRGERSDGADYIAQALDRGAVCIVTERAVENCPCVVVSDARAALAKLAKAWYGDPASQMKIVGITGTNGKTTTTHLLKEIIERCLGVRVGLIGTNHVLIGDEVLPAERTTPDALTLMRLFRRMADAGCAYVVMEVSSHALVQERVAGIWFDAAVFTNLTQDHLDYHATMEDYCDAKARIFRQCTMAVCNGDDEWCARMLRDAPCDNILYGQKFSADIVGWRPAYTPRGVSFTAVSDNDAAEAQLAIPGVFSLYNALAAIAAATALGIPLGHACRALAACGGVRGRAEIVECGAPFTVLIDYAHTPDALSNILGALAGFSEGRIITVFGCGGERDRAKRPLMGAIAAEKSDFVVLTSDNPRGENAYTILREIFAGMAQSETPFAVIEDRRTAIAFALDIACAGDVVALCGKGHETYQIVGSETRTFDEREVVREYFAKKCAVRGK